MFIATGWVIVWWWILLWSKDSIERKLTWNKTNPAASPGILILTRCLLTSTLASQFVRHFYTLKYYIYTVKTSLNVFFHLKTYKQFIYWKLYHQMSKTRSVLHEIILLILFLNKKKIVNEKIIKKLIIHNNSLFFLTRHENKFCSLSILFSFN